MINDEILAARQRLIGRNLTVGYRRPVQIVRGSMQYLLDEISPYKFNGPGGSGKPPWVHVVPVPGVSRHLYIKDAPDAQSLTSEVTSEPTFEVRSEVTSEVASEAVSEAIDRMQARGVGLCGFIAESCPSVAGQIMLPPGYLNAVYHHVRDAGGVCIADEVQTAYGRIGSHFYGFEQQ